MLLDNFSSISYHCISNVCVRMGNDAFTSTVGRVSIVISLNGYKILLYEVLHVPSLCKQLYSLHVHHHPGRCNITGGEDIRDMYGHFPQFVSSEDTSVDYYLHYLLLGCSVTLFKLCYV